MSDEEFKKVTLTLTRKIPIAEKICPQCGKHFLGPKVKVFCSRGCLNKASYAKHAEERRATRRKKYHDTKE